jgi:hypothetical protein
MEIKKDQPIHPVAYKIAGISGLTTGRTQLAFDTGQRTYQPCDFLHAYKRDGAKMCDPEPKVSSPSPSPHCTYYDQHKTTDDKSYIRAVTHSHQVGK